MCCAGCSRASCRRFEIPEGEEAYGMEGEAMAVKHEEYDGEDEKTIVAATTDIASCATPRLSRRATFYIQALKV
jgi:hypothetical protein